MYNEQLCYVMNGAENAGLICGSVGSR